MPRSPSSLLAAALCALALLLAWRPQAKAPASDYITASAKIRDLEQLIMADGTPEGAQAGERGRPGVGPDQETARDSGAGGQTGGAAGRIDDLPQQNALRMPWPSATTSRPSWIPKRPPCAMPAWHTSASGRSSQEVLAARPTMTAPRRPWTRPWPISGPSTPSGCRPDRGGHSPGQPGVYPDPGPLSGTVVAMPVEEGRPSTPARAPLPCSRLPSSTP